MLICIVSFIIGVFGGATGMFFIAKNNQEKFVKAINSNTDEILSQLTTEVGEEGQKLISDLKKKLKE